MCWKKFHCFEEDLWWNTQWCPKLYTVDHLEESDVEHSFEILSTAKKIMLLFFALADEENIYHLGGQKKLNF